MATKKQVDWEKIEIDYRAGVKTLREIASSHDISHVAISKRAKKEGWTKDLTARIKAKAQDLVNKRAVNNKVNTASVNQVIEVNAKLQSDIILAHRTDIPRKRELVAKLFAEVEALTDGGDIVEQMTLALGSNDMDKLSNLAKKITSLPSRVKCVSELMSALKSVIAMERQAFGISADEKETPTTLQDIIEAIDGTTKGLPR